jgi:hypothetical protein
VPLDEDICTHPTSAIPVQHRNSSPDEVKGEPRCHQTSENRAPAREGKARAPERVAKVVHVPREREEAAGIDLALVLRVLLEQRALDLRDELDEDAGGEERGASVLIRPKLWLVLPQTRA